MAKESPQIGEGFGATKVGGGAGSRPPEDRRKALIRKMVTWGAVSAVSLATFVYAFFFQFVPAVKEYRHLVREELRIPAKNERVSWKQFRKGADGGWLLVAEAEVGGKDADWLAYHDPRGLAPDQAGLIREKPKLAGKLGLMVVRASGAVEDYGRLPNLIVNAGENFMVDAFQNTTELENLRFHGIGTGAVAAAETDTGCGTELTTQYNPDSTRATGSLTEGASTNIFRTVGTNTVDAAVAITEFCLMSQAAVPGGTIWSRVVFSAINLASGDSLQTTYDLTVE